MLPSMAAEWSSGSLARAVRQLVQGVKLVGGLDLPPQQLQGAHGVAEHARVHLAVAPDLGACGGRAGSGVRV